METKKEELSLHLETLKKALATLKEVLLEPYSLVARDAAIQRFEYTFELTWKVLKKISKIEGMESPSPRHALRAAHQLGLISNPDLWFEFLDDRNQTSHTYSGLTADKVFNGAKKLPPALDDLIDAVQKKYQTS